MENNHDNSQAKVPRNKPYNYEMRSLLLEDDLLDSQEEMRCTPGANLSEAMMNDEQLDTVWSLEGATMLDGSTHD